MVNLRPIADRTLYGHRDLLQIRGAGCLDPARFNNCSSSCGGAGRVGVGGLLSSFLLSTEFWLRPLQVIEPPFVRLSLLVGEDSRGYKKASRVSLTGRFVHGIKPPPLVSSQSLDCSYTRERLLLGGSRGLEKAAPFPSTQRRSFSSSPGASGGVSAPGLPSPLLMVPPSVVVRINDDGNDYYEFFSIAEQNEIRIKKIGSWQRKLLTPDDAICFGSSHGWLAFIDPRNCYPYLFNPFRHLDSSPDFPLYVPLPALETLPGIRGFRVNKSDRLSSSPSLIKDFIIFKEFGRRYDKPCFEHEETMQQYLSIHNFRNLVMSSAPSLLPFSSSCCSDTKDKNCTVMAIFGDVPQIFFCEPGDDRWSVLGNGSFRDYVGLAYFSLDQRFYAVDETCSIEAFDLSDPSCPRTTTVIDKLPHPRNPKLSEQEQSRLLHPEYFKKMTYLVESSGHLLLVLRFIGLDVSEDGTPRHLYDEHQGDGGVHDPETLEQVDFFVKHRSVEYRTLRFEVYKLDFGQRRWEFVECLGDRAFFVGFNQSFSLSTGDCLGLRENSIYFTDNYNCIDGWCNRSQTFHDNGVYNLDNGCITPFYQRALKRIEPHYPRTAWKHLKQPPIWVPPPNAL